jgi:hypothetical protein
MRQKLSCSWRDIPFSWKISVCAVAIRVYRSPRDAWVADFGQAYPLQFEAKTKAIKEARRLAARYRLRVLSEVMSYPGRAQ